MKRESFIFYSSFAQAASLLGDKARLKLYDAIVKLSLSCAESETELNQVCSEIETSLAQSRTVLAQFLLIKPQIISNFKKFLNGCKGAEYGAFGGAPKGNKNAKKNNPETTPNENVNVNVKENNIPPLSPKGKIDEENREDKDFSEFWSVFPKQRAGSKEKALKAYRNAIKRKSATAEEINRVAAIYAKSDEVARGFAKGAAAWLNDDRFLSDYGGSGGAANASYDPTYAWIEDLKRRTEKSEVAA